MLTSKPNSVLGTMQQMDAMKTMVAAVHAATRLSRGSGLNRGRGSVGDTAKPGYHGKRLSWYMDAYDSTI